MKKFTILANSPMKNGRRQNVGLTRNEMQLLRIITPAKALDPFSGKTLMLLFTEYCS
ncbi:MAG: hypothetical protein K6F78_08880 [Bacteroidaceae bacterium]|nr:hypothetical protein [Bacteroidaceae bacterium]